VVTATVLALSSAALHATWNLILKTATDDDRDLALWGQVLAAGVLALPVLAVVGWPAPAAGPWLALSTLVHIAYASALVGAYRAGDLSLTYPLARGGGALVAAIGGVALLGDHLAAMAWLAIAVVVIGLFTLAGRRSSPRAVGFALATAVTIGAYTVVDSHGARVTSGASYGLALMPSIAVGLSVVGLARGRASALVVAAPAAWPRWAVAGGCTAAAYTLVLIAVRSAPVGYVTMLRESSVVLGALAGWLLLRERLGGRRLASSGIVLAGLLLLVAGTI
jgi:drug/metabolite transporter (DMT)-like permease